MVQKILYLHIFVNVSRSGQSFYKSHFLPFVVMLPEDSSIFSISELSITAVIPAEVIKDVCIAYFDFPSIFAKRVNHKQKLSTV